MEEDEGVARGLREIQPRPDLRQRAKRCGDRLGCGEGVHGPWEVWVRVEHADELWRGDTPVVVATEAGDLLQGLVDGTGAGEVRHAGQLLIVGGPVPERRGEFLHPERGLGLLEGAHGMRGANEAMGAMRHGARDQPRQPRREDRRPGSRAELEAEEDHPVADAATEPKGVAPGLRGHGQERLRHGAELSPVGVHPLRHVVVIAQGHEGLGGHGAVVGSAVCRLWPGVAQALEGVVKHTVHRPPPRACLLGRGRRLCSGVIRVSSGTLNGLDFSQQR